MEYRDPVNTCVCAGLTILESLMGCSQNVPPEPVDRATTPAALAATPHGVPEEEKIGKPLCKHKVSKKSPETWLG